MNAFSSVKARKRNALLRESLGVSRINHILCVHGHEIFNEEEAPQSFDEFGQRSLDRLFPGFTEDSAEQAALSAASTPWRPRCSQTAGTRHDSRRSNSQWRLRDPDSSSFPAQSSPSSRRSVAANSARIQRPNSHNPNNFFMLNTVSSPRNMMTTPTSPHLLHPMRTAQRATAPSTTLRTVGRNPVAAAEQHHRSQRSVATSDEDRGFMPHACLT